MELRFIHLQRKKKHAGWPGSAPKTKMVKSSGEHGINESIYI